MEDGSKEAIDASSSNPSGSGAHKVPAASLSEANRGDNFAVAADVPLDGAAALMGLLLLLRLADPRDDPSSLVEGAGTTLSLGRRGVMAVAVATSDTSVAAAMVQTDWREPPSSRPLVLAAAVVAVKEDERSASPQLLPPRTLARFSLLPPRAAAAPPRQVPPSSFVDPDPPLPERMESSEREVEGDGGSEADGEAMVVYPEC